MKTELNIGYLSDLHLEGSNMTLDNPGWDVLVLAGDISADFNVLNNFLERQIPSDIPVIYTPGNHEFEGKRFEKALAHLENLENLFPNIKFLYNKSFSYQGVKFIGSTLWSNFEGAGFINKEEAKKWAKFNVFDFSSIFVENKNKSKNSPPYIFITPDDMEKEFEKAHDFLHYELKNNPTNETRVVITHFAPSPKSTSHRFSQSLSAAYWVNQIEHLLGFSEFWIHGHVHDTFSYKIEDTQILCNPRGYSKTFDLSPNPTFNKQATFQIPLKHQIKNKP